MARWQRVAYHALTAERYIHVWKSFGLVYETDVSDWLRRAGEMLDAMTSDSLPNVEDTSAFEASIPTSDEYDTALAVQAQNGCLSLLAAYRECQGLPVGMPVGSFLGDTIENYAVSLSIEIGVKISAESSAMYVLQMRWAERLIQQLPAATGITRDIRAENRMNSIVPAL